MSVGVASISWVSAPDISESVLGCFSALSGEAHLTIVLGAGASAPSGLPMWDQFAARLAVLSGLVATEEAARVLLGRQDPSIVLEAAHDRSGNDWAAHLNEALYATRWSELGPSPLHLAAVGHFTAVPDQSTLATLNFDVLLERAVLDEGQPTVRIDTVGRTSLDVPTIHHLHGAVFDGKEYSAIVGYNDFANLVSDPNAWQREFLSTALTRGPLLLAGTSYRDPDIRHWLHLILSVDKPKFPALVTIVREGLGLDLDTFDSIRNALIAEWESIGLTAVTLQDTTDVALVIRELKFLGTDGYRSPAERARRVWDAHRRHFDRLQREYVAQLRTDARNVAAVLGCDVSRATIWLANGGGKLARWASEGMRYLGPRHLKLVPTGHDSPWIAGEAIGSEEVKLKDVERSHGVKPTWKSVLAIPVFASDGVHPDFATGVVSFGLSQSASALVAREEELGNLTLRLSTAWGTRLSAVAFHKIDG